MRGGGKTSSIRSRCLKFHNFVPSDALSESTRLQEQHGTKKITVTSTPWLPNQNPVAGSECPVPVGGIVPSQAPLPQHLLALLRPTPPITHLTPEGTITPIPAATSPGQHSIPRKRKSDDVRRLLNIKISLKEQRKGDEQPLDLSLKRDDESSEEQLRISCLEVSVTIADVGIGFFHWNFSIEKFPKQYSLNSFLVFLPSRVFRPRWRDRSPCIPYCCRPSIRI